MFLFLLAACLCSLLFILFKFLRTPLKLAFYRMNYFTLIRHCPTFVSIIKFFRAPSYEVKFGIRGFNDELHLLLCHGP